MNYYGQYGGESGGQNSPDGINMPPPYYPRSYEVPPEEKRAIRKNYNTIGLVLLILYVVVNVLFAIISLNILPPKVYNDEGVQVIDFRRALVGFSINALCAVAVFIGYCLIAKYDPKPLLRAQNINGGQIVRYIFIVLGLQQLSFLFNIVLMNGLYSLGLEVPQMSYELEHTFPVYAVDFLTSVILAPMGEELIYRGIVLRCAAKVSQRFAVFFSAFIFGIMHGNPYQAVLGFMIGIPMAVIVIKTGSLVPSIILHAANNFMASLPSLLEYFYGEAPAAALTYIEIPVFLLLGVIMLVWETSSGNMKLPPYTKFHRKRTLPILITSWSTVIIMILYLRDLFTSIQPIQEMPEIVEQTARMFIL